MDKAAFYRNTSEFVLANRPDSGEPAPMAEVPANENLFDLGLVTSYSMLELVNFVEQLSGREIDILNSDITRLFTLEGIYDVAFGAK
ncbi:hypothetical protein [Micromonospora sp. NPDC049662]|uniref:hypothetical protein n=1 Tax=Micromonospora sp. NPDC049662 TaxID=3155397 RepID=UPI00341B7CA1